MLAAQGVSLDLAPLYRRRNPRPVRLDEPPPRPPARPPILNQALPELTISEATRMRWVQGQGAAPRLPGSAILPAPRSLLLLLAPAGRSRASAQAGKESARRVRLRAGRHRYLLDHQFFGPDPSRRDPGLTTLLVMPLAATLELIAEAAAVFRPGLKIAALRNVRTYNWLYLQNARQCIRVEAAVLPDGAVRAVVTDGEAKIAEAEVEGSGEQGAGSTEPCTPCSPLPAYLWPQEAVYGQVLFHGPGFQAIRSIDGFSPAVSRATVEAPDPCLLVAGDAGRLLLPISLIDVAGQLVGVMLSPSWTEDEVFLTFPNGIERLEFGQRPARGEPLRAVTHVRCEGTRVYSDVEISARDGRLVLRARNRLDESVRVPGDMYACWRAPGQVYLGRDLAPLFAGVPGAERCGICQTGGDVYKLLINGFWMQTFAAMILGEEERLAFRQLQLCRCRRWPGSWAVPRPRKPCGC